MRTRKRPEEAPSWGLALDFLNSGGSPDEGRLSDPLLTPEGATAWLRAHGLSGPARASLPADRMLHDAAVRLRQELEQVLDAHRARRRIPSLALHGLNRALESQGTVLRLESTGREVEGVEHRVALGPAAALAPIALAAAELLTSVAPARLRRCPASTCRAWFVDTSKGGRRKWCSMARCGNRAKAATHRKRHRA